MRVHDEARGEKESQNEREMERQWMISKTKIERGLWHTTINTSTCSTYTYIYIY